MFLVRLVNGRHQREGRVEVKVGKVWGPICSNDFSMANAAVICRQLGYGFPHQFVENLHYWKEGPDADTGSKLVKKIRFRLDHKTFSISNPNSVKTPFISGLKCTGDETSIEHCAKDEFVQCESKGRVPQNNFNDTMVGSIWEIPFHKNFYDQCFSSIFFQKVFRL